MVSQRNNRSIMDCIEHKCTNILHNEAKKKRSYLSHLNEIVQSSGGRHQDLVALLNSPDLRALASTTRHANGVEPGALSEGGGLLVDLLGELALWAEDDDHGFIVFAAERKTSVFPEPVMAMATMSMPDMVIGQPWA